MKKIPLKLNIKRSVIDWLLRSVRTKIDAQGSTHYFHPECWDRHTAVFGERVTIIVQGVDRW